MIASLIFLELLLRGLGWLIAWQSLHFGNAALHSNETGYTVVCIGDSWTAGQPFGNYPDELQRLSEELEVSPRLRIVNLGHGGANSSQGIRRLRAALPEYHPDIVLVMIGNNDHWNLSESAYWQFMDTEMSGSGVISAKFRVFLHSLRVYKLGKIVYYTLRGLPTPNEYYYLPAEGEDSDFLETTSIDREVYRKQLEYNLLHYIELAQIYNFHLVFQTYFHFHGYRVNEVIRNTALTYRIPLVDNNVLFHEAIPMEQRDRYLVQDGHPNRTGYHFIAENILAVLEKEALISIQDGYHEHNQRLRNPGKSSLTSVTSSIRACHAL